MNGVARWCGRAIAAALLAAISVYRLTVSRLLGARCRFHPSCSVYAEQAIRAHGPVRGSVLAAWRLCRCQPFSAGGLDPVPGTETGTIPRVAVRGEA